MKRLSTEELRQHQLKILDEVSSFCAKHGYNYYLTGGTLIGAVRHNGYIPWDDDIDIIMFRSDYEAFIREFNAVEADYHAYCIDLDDGYNLHYSKICELGTLLKETNLKPNDFELGINIDLFALDPIPEEDIGTRLLDELHLLDKLQYAKSFRMERMKFKPLRQRLLIRYWQLKARSYTKQDLGMKQLQLAQTYFGIESSYCSQITCHMINKLPHWRKEDFQPMLHVFEGREYSIPTGYDHILTEQFGDYMTMPPEDKRITHHAFDAWA